MGRAAGGLLLSSAMQTPAVILAAAFAASVLAPTGRAAASDIEPPSAASPTEHSLLGFRHGRGLDLCRPLTAQSALAVSLSSGDRVDQSRPDVRIMLGLQYSF
jgi:hypothetical protein